MKQCQKCLKKCADTSKICVYCRTPFMDTTADKVYVKSEADNYINPHDNQSEKLAIQAGTPEIAVINGIKSDDEKGINQSFRSSSSEPVSYVSQPKNTLSHDASKTTYDVGTKKNEYTEIHTNTVPTGGIATAVPMASTEQLGKPNPPQINRTASFFDDIPEAKMTDSEAKSILFGKSQMRNEAPDDDGFGVVTNVLSDIEIVRKNTSCASMLFCFFSLLAFIISSCLSVFEFTSAMSRVELIELTIKSLGLTVTVSPVITAVIYGVLCIAPMIIAFGLFSAFCSSFSHSMPSTLSGSFFAVKIGLITQIVLLCILLIASDFVIFNIIDFVKADALVWTCIVSYNLLLAVGVIYFGICSSVCTNVKRSLLGTERLIPPLPAIDIVNVIVLFMLIPIGAFAIFRFGITEMYSLPQGFTVSILITYVSVCLFLFTLSATLTKFRSDIETSEKISTSVELRASGLY